MDGEIYVLSKIPATLDCVVFLWLIFPTPGGLDQSSSRVSPGGGTPLKTPRIFAVRVMAFRGGVGFFSFHLFLRVTKGKSPQPL
jgi:hypothetical protein